MSKKIGNRKDSVFILKEFDEDGFIRQDHADISLNFKERYSQEVLRIENLKPYLMRIIPTMSNQKPFLVLLFAHHQAEATRFCANNYSAKSVETVDLLNMWVLLTERDSEMIDEFNEEIK